MLQKYLGTYGLTILESKTLVGYASENYKITSSHKEEFVLKLNEYSEENWNDLTKENEILLNLKDQLNFDLPYPIIQGENHLFLLDNKIYRLLHFVEGDFWADNPLNASQLTSLGESMAQLTIQLDKMEAGVIKQRNLKWDLQNLMDNFHLLSYAKDPVDRKQILYIFDQYEQFVLPKMSGLRKSLIHNDFNNWNTLLDENKVTGLIDFGDMVYSPLINDLAVALSYVLCFSEDIFKDLQTVLKSYHKNLPLQKVELDHLYLLIAGRIVTSLVNSAQGKYEEPENEYIPISEKPYRSLLNKWLSINPEAFRKVAYEACGHSFDNNEKEKDHINQRREKHFTTGLSLSYDKPIYMSSSAFQYMFDSDGNTYLDAYNNIPLVGHAHPDISRAISKQIRKLNTNTRYHYRQLGEYAEKLLNYFPKRLNKIFFVNSGSAASDLAIRLAKNHTNRKNIFVLEEGYHGNTQIGIQLSHYKHANKGGEGKENFIHHFPLPKIFGSQKDGETFALEAIQKIEKLDVENIHPAAFIAEPISGCGGQVPLADGYLKNVFDKIKANGGLCIVDEVQTGFGRLGSWFWGFEMHDVEADIVILGKPIGNGHPLGAVVCTEEVANSFNNGMEFFSSFGGNPVSCVAGHEVLNILERENLQERAKAVGKYWKLELQKLQKEFPFLADVRGEGLFIGIEIMDNESPGTVLAKRIKNKLKNKFVLSSTDGKYNNVIKVKPPLCFNEDNVDEFCTKLKATCEELASS